MGNKREIKVDNLCYNQLITIGIPLYNMETSICNAIDSCLNQTYKNFEILIVDDKSTDNGVKVIEDKYKKEIKEGKIRIYKREKNGGVSYAMYDMVEQAKGEYIAILDADDTNYPERIEKQYYAIKEAEKTHPNQMVACFCGSYVNNLTTHSHFNIDPNDLFVNFGGGTGHSMYKVADLLAMGNFDKRISRSSDSAMCLKMLLNNCHYVMLSEPLIVYNFREALYKKISSKKDKDYFIYIVKSHRKKLISCCNMENDIYLQRLPSIYVLDYVVKLFFITLLKVTKRPLNDDNQIYKYYLFGFLPVLKTERRLHIETNVVVKKVMLFSFITIYCKKIYNTQNTETQNNRAKEQRTREYSTKK